MWSTALVILALTLTQTGPYIRYICFQWRCHSFVCETGIFCVALAVLELVLYTRLALSSVASASRVSAGIKGVYHYAWPFFFTIRPVFIYFLCLYMHNGDPYATVCMWRSGDSLGELLLHPPCGSWSVTRLSPRCYNHRTTSAARV